jgi:hypothetical protein
LLKLKPRKTCGRSIAKQALIARTITLSSYDSRYHVPTALSFDFILLNNIITQLKAPGSDYEIDTSTYDQIEIRLMNRNSQNCVYHLENELILVPVCQSHCSFGNWSGWICWSTKMAFPRLESAISSTFFTVKRKRPSNLRPRLF